MGFLTGLAVDHVLLGALVFTMDFEGLNGVAMAVLMLCFLQGVFIRYVKASWGMRIAVHLVPGVMLMLIVPGGFSLMGHFLAVWGSITGLSMVSRKWGIVQVETLLWEKRHPLDLAVARVIVSTLVIWESMRQNNHAMIIYHGAGMPVWRDVSKCNGEDQTDVYTGIPIPGLSLWPKLPFSSIRLEEWLLLVAAYFSMVGYKSRLSMSMMAILELRVFGQQMFFESQPWALDKGNTVEVKEFMLHGDHQRVLLVWASLLLAASPCYDTLSVDAMLSSLFSWDPEVPMHPLTKSSRHGFHLNMVLLLLGFGYFGSGMGKAGSGQIFGSNWVNGFALESIIQRHFNGYSELVSQGILRRHRLYLYAEYRMLRTLLSKYPIFLRIGSFLTILWECSFLSLISRPGVPRYLGLGVGVCFHVGVCLVTNINFFNFIIVYLIFIPWRSVYKLVWPSQPLQVTIDTTRLNHNKMAHVLSFLDIFGHLKFTDRMSSIGNYVETAQLSPKCVNLPETDPSTTNWKLLKTVHCWIEDNRSVKCQVCHLAPVLGVLVALHKIWAPLNQPSRRQVLPQKPRQLAKKLQLYSSSWYSFVQIGLVAVCLLGVAWTSLIGQSTSWPFCCFPQFRFVHAPKHLELQVDHDFMINSTLEAWVVGSSGNMSKIDLQMLVKTESAYSSHHIAHKRGFSPHWAGYTELSLQCGKRSIEWLPPWYIWFESFVTVPNQSPDNTIVKDIEWRSSLLTAVDRCLRLPRIKGWDKGVLKICNILRASKALHIYRKEMHVISGPPWLGKKWALNGPIHEMPLPLGT